MNIFLTWVVLSSLLSGISSTTHLYHHSSSVFDPPITQFPSIELVESVPVGDFELESTLVQTWQVLINMTNDATSEIWLSAMYWNLLGINDRKTFNDADMLRFGANRGQELFLALVNAVKRGVRLRILTSEEQIQQSSNELEQLIAINPLSVFVHRWSGTFWYGGGILHQKIWIWDHQHVYIGSANMDWKSLSQVMEIGIWIQNINSFSPILLDIESLFEIWWKWSAPETKHFYSPQLYDSLVFQASLRVPPWSISMGKDQLPYPWKDDALGNISHPLQISLISPSCHHPILTRTFIASAPKETSNGIRTFDEDALVYTIQTAQKRVSLSVMDFLPASMYSLSTHQGSIAWPALTNAIVAGVFGKKGLHVRLLISEWQHSRSEIFQALKVLKQQASLCQTHTQCNGQLEIKIFRVPGWDNTTTPSPPWPAFTRVNHAKYIVTDTRVNIGTSNMEWSYFYTTAGMSVNTDHEPTRNTMEQVFNRNWNSSYATLLV